MSTAAGGRRLRRTHDRRIVPPDQAAFGVAGSDAKYALSGVLPPCAVWGRAVL